jgi:hypothetical protein
MHEKLIVRTLRGAGGLPARDELFYGIFRSNCHDLYY